MKNATAVGTRYALLDVLMRGEVARRCESDVIRTLSR